MTPYIRILTVCSFNRARSVAMAGHLRHALRSSSVNAHIVGAGFAPGGEAPLPEVTAALAHVGIDVAGYRSRALAPAVVGGADLIITAERIHVIRLCEDNRDLFPRTFTLPELVLRAEAAGPRNGAPLSDWLAAVGATRHPADFMASGTSAVPEIADPTGFSTVAVAAAVAEIGEWCNRLAVLL